MKRAPSNALMKRRARLPPRPSHLTSGKGCTFRRARVTVPIMKTTRNAVQDDMSNRCPVCGAIVPAREKGCRGRPRIYCGDACKAFSDRLRMLADTVTNAEIRFNKQAAERMRAEIWALANDVRPYVDQDARGRFAAALRHGRAAKGWTQGQLAAHAGVARKQISRFERATAEPDARTRRALAEIVAMHPLERKND